MADDESDTAREEGRIRAQIALRRIETLEKLASDQATTQSRWLNASLMAVNSAGVVASVAAGDALAPLIGFSIGTGATLLSGVVLQENYLNHLPKRLRDQEPYWIRVSITGERDEDEEAAMQDAANENTWVHWTAPLLGYVSGAAWLASVIALASHNG